MCSFGTPAAPKRSSTWLSTPRVMGLTKPSGGGSEYTPLILRIGASSVGAFGSESPFSQSALFGFTRAPSSDSRLAVIYPIRRRAARVRVVGARRSSRPDDRRPARVAVVLLARVLAEHVEQLARDGASRSIWWATRRAG